MRSGLTESYSFDRTTDILLQRVSWSNEIALGGLPTRRAQFGIGPNPGWSRSDLLKSPRDVSSRRYAQNKKPLKVLINEVIGYVLCIKLSHACRRFIVREPLCKSIHYRMYSRFTREIASRRLGYITERTVRLADGNAPLLEERSAERILSRHPFPCMRIFRP